MSDSTKFMDSGSFLVGCNYWASHAGTSMWSNWDADVVAEDLKQLADEGLQVLRVFPLWPDFQPLTQLYTGLGNLKELRFGEDYIPQTEAGRAGVSEDAMDKFEYFADVAQAVGLKLVVGLVTGWMSGRLFVPQAFEGRNVITDPMVNRWQVRFVRYFVKQFKNHPAVAAWDLGNECNCMGSVESPDQAWVWTRLIADAIRAEDDSRPVVSGMHSLSVEATGHWTMQDQGELTDLLTTHPYPIFTPYCMQDPVHYLRNGFHAAAQSRLYADISGKPCFAEETGTLGPMVCSDKIAADYLRSAMFTLWSQDCRAMLWWCAYDQMHLNFSPYESGACERELGLVRNTREPKPAIKAIGEFRRQIESLPVKVLPPCRREAVCILTEGQDQWAAAYSSFIMAKQAGFDIRFVYSGSAEELPDSELYIMPSVKNAGPRDRRFREKLYDKVRDGATLYVSFASALYEPFEKLFGLDVDFRSKSMVNSEIAFDILDGSPTLTGNNEFRLNTHATTAEVLATEGCGNVAFACNAFGKGKVYYLSFPVEQMLSETPGSFHGDTARPYYKIYEYIAADIIAARAVTIDHPTVTVSEHPQDDGSVIAVIIQHAPDAVEVELKLSDRWQLAETWLGEKIENNKLKLTGNSAAIVLLAGS